MLKLDVKSDHSLVVLNISEKEFWYFNTNMNLELIADENAKAQR